MAGKTPPIRVLPMSTEEFHGWTAEKVQAEYFLMELPFRNDGRYYYRTSGLDAKAGTIVIFQYDNKIIARAEFDRSEPLKPPDGDYRGTLYFVIDSIQVFDPVDLDAMQMVWPNFDRFSNAKRRLSAQAFPEFEKHLTGKRAPLRHPLQVHDLEAASVKDEDFEPTCDSGLLNERVARLLAHKIIERPRGNPKPKSVVVSANRAIERLPAVKAWVLQEAKGICELCQHPGPFLLTNGERFLEVHHVKYLSEQGPDKVENAVAICPNCHRLLHCGADSKKAKDRLYKLVQRLVKY